MKKTIVFLIALLASTAYAGMYFWVDENGVKHFSNVPVPLDGVQVEQRAEIKYDANSDAARRQREEERAAVERQEQSEKALMAAYESIKEGDDKSTVLRLLGQPAYRDASGAISVGDGGAKGGVLYERWTYYAGDKVITIDIKSWERESKVTKKQISKL